MKKVIYLSTLFLFFSCNSDINAESINCKTPEELCELVLETFKDNDSKTFGLLYLNEQDWKFGLAGRLNNFSKEEREKIIKDEMKSMSKEVKLAKYKWRLIRNEINELGVNWSNVKLNKPNYEIVDWRDMNFKKADVELLFEHNSVIYTIYLNNCMKGGNGWKLTHSPRFRGVKVK